VAASKMIGNALESSTKTLPARRFSSEESYRKHDISHSPACNGKKLFEWFEGLTLFMIFQRSADLLPTFEVCLPRKLTGRNNIGGATNSNGV
jgi:hypothetical protein